MKKICLILATAMILVLASCEKKDTPSETKASENSQNQVLEANNDSAKDAGAADGKAAAENNDPAVSEEDAVGKTTENSRIVVKYTGSGKGFGTKEVNAKSQYFVLDGFKEDGSLNAIKAKARVWYFFDDAASYENALAKFGAAVKDQNNTSHFISISVGMDNSWKTYSDIVAEIERKGLSGIIVEDKDYELVR